MNLPCHFRFLSLAALLSISTTFPQVVEAQPSFGKKGATEEPSLTLRELQEIVGPPTVVTFSGKDVPVEDVFQALLKAAGVWGQQPVVFDRKTPTTMSVDWKDVPFWRAAAEVQKWTGLSWDYFDGQPLSLRPTYFSPGGFDGPFMADTPYIKIIGGTVSYRATRAVNEVDVVKHGDYPPRSTQLTSCIYLDPKLTIESGYISSQLTNLPKSGGSGLLASLQGSNFMGSFNVNLPLGLHFGETVPSVQGVVRVKVQTSTKNWKLPDLLTVKDARQEYEKRIFVIEKAITEDSWLHLDVTLSAKDSSELIEPLINPYPPDVVGPSTLTASTHWFDKLQVLDSTGQPLLRGVEYASKTNTRRNPQKITAHLTYRLGSREDGYRQGPFSMNWDLPTGSRNLDVPFELKNLNVP